VNFGLFPELPQGPRGRDRKKAQSARALTDLAGWLG
jgi:methylenetetrahydrofolate--tRNA-(uracil-5-)-methyltransferase